jgi:predicted porin
MKINSSKTVLAIAASLALGAAFVAAPAFAQTAPAVVAPSVTIYGRIDMAVESANDGALSKTMFQNFASRLGFKGERGFNTDLSGMFQVETGVAPDDTANSKTFASRNSFVGLKSKSMGSVLIGTHDMPLKSLEGTAAQLWAEGEAMEVIIHGKGTLAGLTPVAPATTPALLFKDVHTRQKNVLLYQSPKFSNIVVKAAYSPDETQTATTNQSMYSLSAEYNDGTYNAGIATQSTDKSDKTFAMSATKITLGAKMGDFIGGAAFSMLDNNATLASAARKTTNSLFTIGYIMGATTLKFNYGSSGESASGAADDLTMTAFEVNYALDKQTNVYASYAQIANNTKAKGTFTGADNFPATGTAGNDPTALTLGVRYSF